jgi:endonuclease/exonuclease/phosphatase (EEP) superfamily protein YafD
VIFWAGAALIALGLAGLALGRFGWPWEMLANIAPQIGAFALLYALSMALTGRPAVALAALAAAIISFCGAREMFAPASPQIARRDARIVWANLFDRRDAFERVMALAARESADLVLVAELPDMPHADIERISGPFMHHAGRPNLHRTKVAAFSRTPIQRIHVLAANAKRPGLCLIIETPSGALVVAGIHPSVPATPAMTRGRAVSIGEAFALADSSDGPIVLVGDFNTPPWSETLRAAERGDVWRRARLGPVSTWSAPLPILGLPIDHAFGAHGARVSARLGPGIGSDHMPLIVDVSLTQ